MANQRNEKYQVSEHHIEQSCLPGLGHLYWGCYMRQKWTSFFKALYCWVSELHSCCSLVFFLTNLLHIWQQIHNIGKSPGTQEMSSFKSNSLNKQCSARAMSHQLYLIFISKHPHLCPPQPLTYTKISSKNPKTIELNKVEEGRLFSSG